MINGEILKNAIISGAHNISVQKNHINDLNIFPVPDGDTGTNMSMTVMAAAKALEDYDGETAGEVADIAAKAMLRGARGNSGVITSILFRGFAQGLKDVEEVNGKNIAAALGIGVEAAYKAVAKPTEGTILTVARMAYEAGLEASHENSDPVFVWQAIVDKANEALAITPELLPVLKKAGVVDAGGKGLCSIFEGMLCCIKDGVIVEYEDSQPLTMESFDSAAAEFDDDIEFTYCTEIIVGRDPACELDPDDLRSFLQTIGDCVVMVNDEEIIKVDQHIHAGSTGKAADELALAAVDGQHGLQTKQSALLTGSFAVGRAIAVAVFCGDGDALAVQNSLHLFGVAGGMDAAVDHLIFLQIAELRGFDLLDLSQEITGIPQLLGGVTDLCAHGGILFIGEAGTNTCAFFHQNSVTVGNNGTNFNRSANNTVFACFNVFQNAKNHNTSSIICGVG